MITKWSAKQGITQGRRALIISATSSNSKEFVMQFNVDMAYMDKAAELKAVQCIRSIQFEIDSA